MTASLPAGWYPDPSGTRSELRWWDGSVWTEQTTVTAGHRSPMTEQVLFVSQKPKIVELTNEYAVFAKVRTARKSAGLSSGTSSARSVSVLNRGDSR